MVPQRSGRNPYYVPLLAAGIAFTLTACAYGVLMVRSLRLRGPATEPGGLLAFLDQHGLLLLMAELGVLAVLTVATMHWDARRERTAVSAAPSVPQEEPSR